MLILTGNSLGERQKDLNEQVNKAAANKAFDKPKKEPGIDDAEIIFMIDLAARHKNIDFVLETIKSNDVVHISRTLNKCTWLSDDEFASSISVENLHNNVFPFVSIKMKKKLLCMLSINLKNEARCKVFYEYCMKEKLFKIAIKFLFKTSESFKKDVILQKSKAFNMLLNDKEETLANFIGNSFTLAETFLENMDAGRNDAVELLRYMYSISNEKYLSLLEKYKYAEHWRKRPNRFGSRLSKEIIKKHKDKVLKNPLLYINLLNKDKITKNSTISDVKVYAISLLPDEASLFWSENFYKKYQFILDVIPAPERFSFIKKIFTEKYPDEQFEMCKDFYNLEFYKTMTTVEKEDWALSHIATGEEILGSGKDYKWYEFVQFDKAFDAIKKYILITPLKEKRMKMINVLVHSAKTQKDLETLLNFFYNKHVNELSNDKMQFLDKLIENHNVFEFEETGWMALEKIFYSLDVYSSHSRYLSNYRTVALIYYIIKDKTVPIVLYELIDNDNITAYDIKRYSDKLSPENENKVFQYMHTFYITALRSLACDDDLNDKKVTKYITAYLDLLYQYSKTKYEIADNMNTLIKARWDQFEHHSLFNESGTVDFSEKTIKQYIKKDATLVIDKFPLIKRYIQNRFGRTNWLFKKLKIYFHHDIAKRYLQLLNDCLSADDVHYRMAEVAVYGIFKLADEPFKIQFIQKYVPTNPKIDHANISRNLLTIQQAICWYLCVSRPALPIACVNQFITGDYVHNCLPIFNYYSANLPISTCIKFVESIIDKPVSIQKHGLRLAFQCFSPENLKTLINNIWKRSKNVSLRKILYKSLYCKILDESDQTQLELFELLNTLTIDLHQDDDAELFNLFSHNDMPDHLKGLYLVSGWKAVKKLPERSVNFEYMTKVVNSMGTHLNLMPENEVTAITGEHVFKMLDEKNILNTNLKKGLEKLLNAKWELTLRHLANVCNEKQFKKSMEVVKHVLKICFEMWYEVNENKYVMREFCRFFVLGLQRTYDCNEIDTYSNMNNIAEAILKDLQDNLPVHEIYTLVLEVRLSSISRDIVVTCKQEFGTNPDNTIDVIIVATKKYFAEAFVKMVQEYMNNGQYFASFYAQIESGVNKQLTRIMEELNSFSLNLDDMFVLMCVGLLKFDITEVYLLVLRFLPLNYEGTFINEYDETLNRVQLFKNTEVQCFMFEKFVNQDFMFRNPRLSTEADSV